MANPVVHMFPCLDDNYGFLLHDPQSGETATIDTPDADRILAEADTLGWRITQIWNTHWHRDHAGGNARIKAATGCAILAPRGEVAKIGHVDRSLSEGDRVELGTHVATVLDTPGHTAGHIVYVLEEPHLAFVGDTLFALGCGRLFEGTPAQMWASLCKLRALPDDTMIYCAHEYTGSNAAFALSVDPQNSALKAYVERIRTLLAEGRPTVPTTMAAERAANPFLRADDPVLQSAMRRPGDAIATFAEVRERKNDFKAKF